MYKNLKRVLIVDPNPDFRLLLASMLNPLEILTACDGLEAIELLKVETVDMLITDFNLPHKNGVELLHWCRGNDIHVPVIFTSIDEKRLRSEEVALADCCATLMKKPLNLKTLSEAVVAADQRTHHDNCLHHFGGMVRHDIRL